MLIGDRIKARREQLGLSQEDLALALGYKSRSSINKIELNRQNLTQSKIKSIADALRTTPSFIMGWEVDPDKTTAPAPHRDERKKEIMELFDALPDADKDRFIKMARAFAGK